MNKNILIILGICCCVLMIAGVGGGYFYTYKYSPAEFKEGTTIDTSGRENDPSLGLMMAQDSDDEGVFAELAKNANPKEFISWEQCRAHVDEHAPDGAATVLAFPKGSMYTCGYTTYDKWADGTDFEYKEKKGHVAGCLQSKDNTTMKELCGATGQATDTTIATAPEPVTYDSKKVIFSNRPSDQAWATFVENAQEEEGTFAPDGTKQDSMKKFDSWDNCREYVAEHAPSPTMAIYRNDNHKITKFKKTCGYTTTTKWDDDTAFEYKDNTEHTYGCVQPANITTLDNGCAPVDNN